MERAGQVEVWVPWEEVWAPWVVVEVKVHEEGEGLEGEEVVAEGSAWSGVAFWGVGETVEQGGFFSEGQEILEGEKSRERMKRGQAKRQEET